MSIADVAELLGVHARRVKRMVARGEFPAPVPVGRMKRWAGWEVAEWAQIKLGGRGQPVQ